MKHQQFCGPQSGKFVSQLPEGVTFAYDLHLGHSRDRWKGPTEEYNVEIEEKQYSLEWWQLISEKRCVGYVHYEGSLQ